jgi:CubicO group peptidase (beta-lactamase class C family)
MVFEEMRPRWQGMVVARRNSRLPTLLVFALISAALLVLSGCGAESDSQYIFQTPKTAVNGLETGSISEANIDSALFGRAVERINNGDYGEVHSLLIFKDGKLVVEEYFPGHDYKWDGPDYHGRLVNWNSDERHNIHSVGKSITSAAVGIAVNEGFIESIDQSIFDYLPDHQHLNVDGKDQIKIEHLLTMTSGLAWDEWSVPYSSPENDIIKLWLECDDQVTCILEAPLEGEPGTEFTYSGGNMVLLGEIVENATDMEIEAFANEYLFAPLGIDPVEWVRFDSGVIYAGGDQYMTPREMIKFGVTYLNNGVWEGDQIVAEKWVESSATPYSGPDNTWLNHVLQPIPPGDNIWGRRGYSYTWWTHEFSEAGEDMPAYWALGFGGQNIYILPEQDTVVVFTGGNYTTTSPVPKILTDYVLPSIASR